MNVARFDFSYGSHAYHQVTIDNLRTAIQNTGILCAVMLDTKGPEIRTGFLKQGKPIELIKGQEMTVSVDYTIIGDSSIISVSYKKLAEDLKPGDVILCSGISLTVLSCDKSLGLVRCRCDNSAVLGEREKVRLPGNVNETDLPALTEQDKEDILQWGVPNNINIIALSSSVCKGSDLDQLRNLLGVHRRSIMLLSKFESEEEAANVADIMAEADAVMVDRLSIIAQKGMIKKANALGLAIITAIHMLPTIAEAATDITNAVLEGTDCVMLSGTTAAAEPETAVQTMSRLCIEAEASINYKALHKKIKRSMKRPSSKVQRTAASAVMRVVGIMDAKVIVVVARSGFKAEVVAKFRPSIPIVYMVDPECPNSEAHLASRRLVYRGVIPLMWSGALESTKELISFGIKVAKDEEICKVGDLVLALRVVDGCPIMLPLMVT